ncbi:MAG: M20/M25/M40 family metallo-hydrolase [Cyclobacteriaceae bacterium]|jgi:tripeptide aminopeptidase
MKYILYFLALTSLAFASHAQTKSKASSTNDPYTRQVQALSKNQLVQNAFSIIDQLEPTTRKEHIELTQVPAPPFKESVRAAHYQKMLAAAGADKVWIDSVGNVLALRKGKKSTRTVVLDAHLDTVFPEGTDVTVKEKGDTLFAPGIADDTRGLIAMLTVLRALEKASIETTDDVLFIGTVGEEGLGDLRGVKYIVEKSNLTIDAWIALDGTAIDQVINGALGSIRYKVTITGPGGHSWGAFGIGNPHHAMAKSINYFSDAATQFTSTGVKTSFNIGRTGGGTSVNSIPFESWAEVDMRSESPLQLKKIDSIFKLTMKKGVTDYNQKIKQGPSLQLSLQQIGYRPSGATPESSPLVQKVFAAARHFSVVPQLAIVSTNANVPIAHGIPAVTIGAGGKSDHEHALGEWWLNEKGADGIKFALLTLLLEAGIEKNK